jgi:hypothetical protein
VREKNGALRRLTNAEIAKNPQYSDFSLDQAQLGIEDFYDRMDDVMSPAPLDPLGAMKEVITALDEQVKTRVTSVENGRKFQSSGRGEAEMPDGASIFETTGAWEDFATPSRDLRLLIAMDVVRTFPDRVAQRPERYAMPAGKSVADVKAELESVLASELAARKFSYTRRWLRLDARAQGRDRPCGSSGDGVQSERLRRAAVGRGGQERRGIDVQAACLGGATREDDRLPHLVPRAAPSTARLVRASNPISAIGSSLPGLIRQSILFVRSSCDDPSGGWNRSIGKALFRLDAGRADHRRPFLGIVDDELAEIGGRSCKYLRAQIGEAGFISARPARH